MAGIAHRRWVRVGHGLLCTAVLCTGIAAATAQARDGEPCGAGRPTLSAAAVLGCVGDDIAHVTTGISAGSAVLLPDGRLVTNAHVVDPFSTVDVAFRDGEAFEAVPVVGIDLQRDLAVLGPIDRHSDVVLAGPRAVETMAQGDPLFLVGYPGDIEPDDPVPAISEGILSRERVAHRFGLRYLQTDASIGGGQSGGALVDGEGRVAGISGLAFANGFALALSAPDVEDGLAAIAADGGTAYQPTGVDEVKSGEVREDAEDEPPLQLSWAPAEDDRDVELELDGSDTIVEVVTGTGETLWSSAGGLFELDDFDLDDFDLDDVDLDLDEVVGDRPRRRREQTAEFTIPAGELAIATLLSFDGDAEYRTSVPATEHRDEDNGREVRTGDRVEGSIVAFEYFDSYEIRLERGQRIDIYVGSVGADPAFAVYRKGQDYDDAFFVDDSQEGFYGTDAHRTFTADQAGTHIIEVGSMLPGSFGYVLQVHKA